MKKFKIAITLISPLIMFIVVFISLFSSAKNVFAQESRSYYYDSIDITVNVNSDSTVDIIENQTYNFTEEYHKGWRSISFSKIDSISDIRVIDGETNTSLVYSDTILEKTDPSSWGKYTFYEKDGAENIEWYYNLQDTKHNWFILYKVHGAIGFYKDHDEFYWNLFTNYDVPVKETTATVIIPQNVSNLLDYKYDLYVNDNRPDLQLKKYILPEEKDRIHYSISEVSPKISATILASWPKGFVSHASYWKDYFNLHWGTVIGFSLMFLSLIVALLYWYFKEKYPMKNMTIVPQYEPPEHLPPAMAEIVITENTTKRSWPATIVDLAVRGYIKIEEEDKTTFERFFNKRSISFIAAIIVFGIVYSPGNSLGSKAFFLLFMPVSSVLIFFLYKDYMFSKDYFITKTNKPVEDLKFYEKSFFETLFFGSTVFSTREFRKAKYFERKNMSDGMKETKKLLYEELNKVQNIYKIPIKSFSGMNFEIIIRTILIIIFVIFIFISVGHSPEQTQMLAFALGIVFVFGVLFFSVFNPLLNEKGIIAKEDWLGFKMYLETAERYRMQNLTPDLFEKYLPYAMIFEVEKKWAKAFNNTLLQTPNWYVGRAGMASALVASHGVSPGFSASSFTSSFSASFASSFSSSGAGGGRAGGGGAGGGGGGGGGGAS